MKKLIVLIAILISTTLNSQVIYNWSVVPDVDRWELEHDENSNGIYVNDLTIYPYRKLVLNADTISMLNYSIKPSDISNWNGKLNISDTLNKWAKKANYLLTEVDGSVSNEIQTISIVGSTISLSNSGGSINLPAASYISAPFIEVTKSASQTITANSLTTVVWGAESTKTGFTHSNSTNNSRITLDSNGNYEGGVTLWVSTWNSVTTSRFEIQLFKNGSFYKELFDMSILSSNDPSVTVPLTITNGTAGDYYEIKFLQNSGASRDITTTSFYWIRKI